MIKSDLLANLDFFFNPHITNIFDKVPLNGDTVSKLTTNILYYNVFCYLYLKIYLW